MRCTFRLVALLYCVSGLMPSTFAQQTSEPTTRDAITPSPRKVNARPASAPTPPPPPPPTTTVELFDKATIEKMAAQCVKLETEAGVIEMEMLPEAAPETVRNFLNLAATGAFDTTTFSRVVKDFVVQGGNPSTRQTITPELISRMRRTIPDEPNYVPHIRGIVSMARPAQDNSATTHFFILVGDEAKQLDGKFTAFGRVTRGMNIADSINSAPVDGEKPLKPVQLIRAVVASCPLSQPPLKP